MTADFSVTIAAEMYQFQDYQSEVIRFADLREPTDIWELGETIGEGTYGLVHVGINKRSGRLTLNF